MGKTFDLRDALADWPFDPDNNARIVTGADGRDIMQVRTPLGVEQYELEGRPDGKRPRNLESLLEHHRARLAKAEAAGKPGSFKLSGSDCAELFEEGVLFYFRYLHLFQIKEWQRTVRDTGRNLSLFDFVRKHAAREQDREHLEQWRPYIFRMHAIARTMLEWDAGRHDAALRIAHDAIAAIDALPDLDNETFRYEQERSVEALRDVIKQIEKSQPLSEVEILERALHHAVESEEFEKAAHLRDRLRTLRGQPAVKD